MVTKAIRRLREMAGSIAALVGRDGEEERIEMNLAVENRMLRVGDRCVLLTAKQARIVSILLLPPMEGPKPTEILGAPTLASICPPALSASTSPGYGQSLPRRAFRWRSKLYRATATICD